MPLTDEQKALYLLRSFRAVDGLWFMKVEERLGFDATLDIDEDVWKVLAKIQARMMRSLLDAGDGLDGLEYALSERLCLEGFFFEMENVDGRLHVTITKCPWHDIMIRAGRGHLSEAVGERMCPAENDVWAAEFGASLDIRDGICRGCSSCLMIFKGR